MHPHDVPSVSVPSINVHEIPTDAVLLDVREDAEWQAGHVKSAVHIPMGDVPQRLAYDPGPITADVPLVVMCKVGGRSAQVTAWLRRQGYSAVNLKGGMLAWAAAGREMVADGSQPPEVL